METLEVNVQNIPNLVQNVWGSVLSMDLVPTSISPVTGGFYTSWVKIIGSNNLAVVLKCSKALAGLSTSRMFGEEETQVNEDQVKDSLKELVNILGGNIKGMMTKYHFLSMPSVCDPEKEPRFPGTESLCEFHFKYQEEDLELSVLRMD